MAKSIETQKASVEDVERQIKDIEKDYNYRLVEWPIESLIKKFVPKSANQAYKNLLEDKDKSFSAIIVPEYQRNYVWKEEQKSKFIESVFMKVPIPPLFGFELDDEGNIELIDGVQRLSTIKAFASDGLVLSNLEVLDFLNGFKFSELDVSRQRKFNNLSLRLYLLNNETDEGIRADIFNRINSTSERLKPAEIRKGSFINNPFYDFILECTRLREFTDLYVSKNDEMSRGRKEELITRFFAYSDKYLEFDHSVTEFLNDYIKDKEKFSDDEKSQKKEQLINSLNFVKNNLPNGFRKSTTSATIPMVRFDAIAVGVNLALQAEPNLANLDLKWLDSTEFFNWVTSGSSNNKNKVIGRINFVRDCLLNKIDLNNLNYDG